MNLEPRPPFQLQHKAAILGVYVQTDQTRGSPHGRAAKDARGRDRRPRKPAHCLKCGALCPSVRGARAQCVGVPRVNLPYGRLQSAGRCPVWPSRNRR
jgi:hypothetical protein